MTLAPTVAISVKLVPLVERSILKLLSLLALSLQVRLIWLAETALAVRLEGAAGGAGPAGAVSIVNESMLAPLDPTAVSLMVLLPALRETDIPAMPQVVQLPVGGKE